MSQEGSNSSLWARAATAAAKTPASRNRYVDFLRAVSILAVVCGHWVMAAPYMEAGQIRAGHMLDLAPWTRWLTWGFQVMPVFFIVGGFSNGITWEAAKRDARPYGDWLSDRLRRLVGPLLPVLVAWAVIAAVANWRGVNPEVISVGSRMALIPTWFLAVYVGVVLLAPVTYGAWRRFGFASFWALVAAAVVVDVVFFRFESWRWLGWSNYAFVWLAVHQLGYAWRDGRLGGLRRALPWCVGGLAALVLLIKFGPYPHSMVGVPGEAVSNTQPPKITLLALGAFQGGLLLMLEAPGRRWLERGRAWTATVLINGMIMTVYLWHLTASTLVFGLAALLGGIGLQLTPGTSAWWSWRPAWVGAYIVALALLSLVFARFERPAPRAPGESAPAGWRLVVGALVLSYGLSTLVLGGVSGDGWFGLRVVALLLPFAGAVLMGMGMPKFLKERAFRTR